MMECLVMVTRIVDGDRQMAGHIFGMKPSKFGQQP